MIFNTHYQDDWRGFLGMYMEKMKDLSVDKLRDSMWEESHRLLDGGWHWSYFGGVERYRQKMTAGADSQQLLQIDIFLKMLILINLIL